jgi:type IV fimbrial biogenesis protein FimT
MRARTTAVGGFGLIELMVGIAVLAVLTMLAVPSFSDWMRSTRLRSAAESLRSDLQAARAEAIRTNAGTRLQFVTTLDDHCALSPVGTYWVVNAGLSTSPAGACGNSLSATVSPYLVRKSPIVSSTAADLVLSVSSTASGNAAPPALGFSPLGLMAATTDPATDLGTVTVTLTSSTGTCVAAGGAVRCLNVIVSPAGDARICDPARSGATDPMTC